LGENYLCALPDRLVDDVVVGDGLLLGGKRQVLHALVDLAQVYVAEAAIEQDLARVEFKFEAKLLVIDVLVAPEVEQRVVEVRQSLFEVAHQKVGHALLKVRDGEVLVGFYGVDVAGNLHGQTIRLQKIDVLRAHVRRAWRR
jgi:hypothetical protein